MSCRLFTSQTYLGIRPSTLTRISVLLAWIALATTAAAGPTPLVAQSSSQSDATPCSVDTPCMNTIFAEYFDGVTPPALPPGFSTSFTAGPANCVPEDTCAAGSGWITSASAPDTPPNCAFHDDPSCVTDSILDSAPFFSGLGYELTFRHSFDLENGFDGAVLEISTNGGPFVDIVAAGGEFQSGGYNGTIANGFFSPIAGRSAWTGNSNGYITTHLYLPFTNSTKVLRFRLATDCKGAGTGWKIDTVKAFFRECGTPSPTPSPTPVPTPP